MRRGSNKKVEMYSQMTQLNTEIKDNERIVEYCRTEGSAIEKLWRKASPI